MKWFSVHALHYFEYKQGEQNDFCVFEHVYLIRADSSEEAFQRGKIRAKQDEGDSSGSLTINDRAACLRFAGIRVVVECQDLDLETGLPTDGTELTYSEFTVDTRDELAKLIAGEPALVVYDGP